MANKIVQLEPKILKREYRKREHRKREHREHREHEYREREHRKREHREHEYREHEYRERKEREYREREERYQKQHKWCKILLLQLLCDNNHEKTNICIINIEGNTVSQDTYNVGSITNTHGNIVIGKNNTVSSSTVQFPELADATQQLMNELKKLNLPLEKESEIEEMVESISKQVSSEKPNKTMLSSLLDGLTKIIDTVGKTPALITAYEAWKKCVPPFSQP